MMSNTMEKIKYIPKTKKESWATKDPTSVNTEKFLQQFPVKGVFPERYMPSHKRTRFPQ